MKFSIQPYMTGALRSLLVALLVVSALSAEAAVRYVRAGATGNGSGADWSNAYPAMPASLVRGDTYYVADGNYGAYTFDDATSGTTPITIKKATASDHGSGTGWLASHGDGQALFADLTFRTGYYILDGRTRNNADWTAEASYGIDINGTIVIDSAGVNGLSLSHFSAGGTVGATWPNVPTFAIKMTVGSSPSRRDLYFGNCFLHNAEILIHSRSNENVTIEQCQVGPGFGKEAISHQTGSGWVIRNNRFIDSCVLPANEGCTAVIGMFNFTGGGDPADCKCDNMQIYGNVFAESGKYSAAKADGVIILNATNNSKFYNNNVVRHQGTQSGAVRLYGSGNEIKNNLWYWVGNYDGSWGGVLAAQANSVQNNWCFYGNPKPARLGADCSAIGGTKYVGVENPFVNDAAGNYALKSTFAGVSPRNLGLNLGAPFNIDMNGRPRGADGGWDIGALESDGSGGGAVSVPAPTGLRVVN